MSRTDPFHTHVQAYDAWFDAHPAVFSSELAAVEQAMPSIARKLDSSGGSAPGVVVEVGIGTGRFATRLGITTGIEPSAAMAQVARTRNLDVLEGTAESMPLADHSTDVLLYVTTFCFLKRPDTALQEARRVLRPGGHVVIAIIDIGAPGGRIYLEQQSKSIFYRDAVFHSANNLDALLTANGFRVEAWYQTLFSDLHSIRKPDPVRTGYGEGLFAVVRAANETRA